MTASGGPVQEKPCFSANLIDPGRMPSQHSCIASSSALVLSKLSWNYLPGSMWQRFILLASHCFGYFSFQEEIKWVALCQHRFLGHPYCPVLLSHPSLWAWWQWWLSAEPWDCSMSLRKVLLILSTYLISLLGRWDLGSENLDGVSRNTLANKWLTNKAEHRNRMEECNYHGISKWLECYDAQSIALESGA